MRIALVTPAGPGMRNGNRHTALRWAAFLRAAGSTNDHDLGLFLERVSKFPRIINVSNLKVKALEKSTAVATVPVPTNSTYS